MAQVEQEFRGPTFVTSGPQVTSEPHVVHDTEIFVPRIYLFYNDQQSCRELSIHCIISYACPKSWLQRFCPTSFYSPITMVFNSCQHTSSAVWLGQQNLGYNDFVNGGAILEKGTFRLCCHSNQRGLAGTSRIAAGFAKSWFLFNTITTSI